MFIRLNDCISAIVASDNWVMGRGLRLVNR